MAEIYGLVSMRNGLIRYVGQTKGTTEKRFLDHWKSKSHPKVAAWIRAELWFGFDVDSIKIEECEDERRGSRETYWMRRLPGLLNQRKIGYRPDLITSEDREHLAQLQACISNSYDENWQGIVGLRRYPPNDHQDFEAFGLKVCDAFGNKWGFYGVTFVDVEDAIAFRQTLRSNADKYHLELFETRASWPPDTASVNLTSEASPGISVLPLLGKSKN
jgi:hypothetical protein